MKTLGAVMFVHNGDEFDYCYRETILCMKSLADKVVVVDAGSNDGSDDVCRGFADAKTTVICLTPEDWKAQKGRQKISYFQNYAKSRLGTDYYMVIQADEILHEASFSAVRQAISYGQNAYMATRFNLWFDPWHRLNVEQRRKPCSTQVIRLAKTKYDSVDDGETIAVPNLSVQWVDKIRIYHMGFVRDPKRMKRKVIHIQEQVFGINHDPRVDHSDSFDPGKFFAPEDVVPIQEKLPVFIQKWAAERFPNGPVSRVATPLADITVNAK